MMGCMKHLCVYHSSDLDGKCSGAIAMRSLVSAGYAVELFGVNYGEPFPWERVDKDTHVTMLDFSLQPFDKMIELSQRAGRLTWIDHHKSAIESYNETNCAWDVRLRIDKAACELTWNHFHRGQPMPPAVHLLGRYDIWAWEGVEGALEFQYGMRGVDNAPESGIWDSVLIPTDEGERVTDSIIAAGRHILKYVQKQNGIYAKSTSFPLWWHGLRFIASNAQLTNSALFDAVFDPKEHDGMMAFAYRKGQWHVHLYSTPEVVVGRGVDMGSIAKEFGGGGHPGAAGFQCRELPFELPLRKQG